MKNEGLVSRMKNQFYKGLTASSMVLGGLGVYGCGDPPVGPDPDMPPRAVISEVSPMSGVSPLEVGVRYLCEDDKGINAYTLKKGNQVIANGNSPIDTSLTFTASDSLSKGCTDTSGQTTWNHSYITVNQPHVNQPPKATLTVNPLSGKAPLESRIQYACSDPDGASDIAESYLRKGNDTLTTTSTDSTFTFGEGMTQVEGYCRDNSGAESRVGPFNVEATAPDMKDVIAFLGLRGGNSDVYLRTLDAQGDPVGELERLTLDPKQDAEPAWSPDGNRLVFRTNRNGKIELYTMKADGTDEASLTQSIDYANNPSWSPLGDRVAFKYKHNGLAGIAIINIDGTGFTKLVEEPDGSLTPGWPTWSPDGSQIAYHTHRDGNWEVYTMRAEDGSNQTNTTNNPATDQQPDWSPDGTEIGFISDRATPGVVGEFDIYRMKINGADVTRVTNAPGREIDPAWSPDGSKFAFTRVPNVGDPFHLYTTTSTGTNWKQITFEGQNAFPAWRPRN